MTITIILYLLGCYLYYDLVDAKNNNNFIKDIIPIGIWPIIAIIFIVVDVYKYVIKKN